ncbi:integral membrane transport protein [Streptomyces sp. SID5476]|uniref:Integral membrane transport protein n=1 Tax=Streptomyces bottropensis ATCC 25435 TaxID=1054862 RepID=M3EEL0_9ACTN|nr:integral membrane transport protein [Streptomyces bottropensis ATCC 25435]MZD19920.1 integral membrane transport protein [Streptomyces sp. SID5476]
MSIVKGAVHVVPPGNPITQSVRDSLVVAKRNLIRMSRIPNPDRSCRPGSISQHAAGRYVSAGKEEAK